MMEKSSVVMDAITKVLQNNHLNFTDSPSMMGSDTYVVNVGIKQLQKKFLKPISWQLSMVKNQTAPNQSLKLDTQVEHNGLLFSCKKCDFQCPVKYYLKYHMASNVKNVITKVLQIGLSKPIWL